MTNNPGIQNEKLGNNMFGDKEHQNIARKAPLLLKALLLLIGKAKAREIITYGDLADKFKISPYGYPMSQMLGIIAGTLDGLGQRWQESIPRITSLVVKASTGYPSYPRNISNEVFDREFERIYKYPKWDVVQKTLLPDSLAKPELHPIICQEVLPIFEIEFYGTAVFEAFKRVEIAVRRAGGYEEKDLGTDLMRKAFHVDNGNLTDQSRLRAEKQARSDLFAGAIGSYKNPASHREVKITAAEAIEAVIFASHLLRIVDSISQSKEGQR